MKMKQDPTQGDANAALLELNEVFADFPYAKESHASVPIAALLTLLGRPAIEGACPAFLFDASTRGSGKTLQSDAISLIATGRTSAKMAYPMHDEELEKVLGAYALRGASLINFDNVNRLFGGGPLDRCLTAEDTVELRILGKSEIPTLRWRAVIVATGNNLALAGDTARRVLVARLESPLENPESREDFRHPDLLDWVRQEQVRLVYAGLSVLRAYFVAGRPDVGIKPWGSFGPWSKLVAAAIVHAGGANPMDARPHRRRRGGRREGRARARAPRARALRQQRRRHHGEGPALGAVPARVPQGADHARRMGRTPRRHRGARSHEGGAGARQPQGRRSSPPREGPRHQRAASRASRAGARRRREVARRRQLDGRIQASSARFAPQLGGRFRVRRSGS